MQLTTRETTALNAALTDLSDSITALTAVIITDHVECGDEIAALKASIDNVNNTLPTESATGGTGAASTTTEGAAAFRAKVEAGYDEA